MNYIYLSFIFIIIKIIILIIINTKKILFFLRDQIIFYFLIDLFCHTLSLAINFTSFKSVLIKNILFKLIFIGTLFQLFSTINFYLKIKKIKSLLNNFFYLLSFFELLLMIHQKNFFAFSIITFLKTIKTILLLLYISNTIKILIYEPFIELYQYKVKSIIKNYLILIFIINTTKIFFVDFIILLYVFFPSIEESITTIFKTNNYTFLNYLFTISSISFFLLILFKKIETNLLKEDSKEAFEEDIYLKFTEEEMEKIIYQIIQIKFFYISLIEKNIEHIKNNCISYKILNIKEFHAIYKDLPKEILNNYIKKNYYLFFNELYEKRLFKKIIENDFLNCPLYDFIIKNKIIAIYPFYINKELSSYTIIYENTIINYLPNKILQIIRKIHENIEFFLENIINNDLYIKLNYQKHVSKKNIEEKNNNFINNLKQTTTLMNEATFFFIYEKNKKKILITNNKEYPSKKRLENFLLDNYKKEEKEKNSLEKKYIFFADDNKYLPLLTTKKIQLEKKNYSFSVSLPFLDKNLQLINNFFYTKIEQELFLTENYFTLDKNLFANLYNSFEIKIIIGKATETESFSKITEYFAYQESYETIFLSLKNIDDFFYEKILSYYNYLNTLKKPHLIILKDIDIKNIYFQKIIIEKHIAVLSTENDIKNKIIIFLSDPNKITQINKMIYEIAKITIFEPTKIDHLEKPIILEIISNYFENIIKKNLDKEEIKKIIHNTLEFKDYSIYQLIDIISKKIYLKNYENNDTESEKYIKESILLQKKALKNNVLMQKLNTLYNNNYTKIATLLGVHKSTISRYYKKNDEQ